MGKLIWGALTILLYLGFTSNQVTDVTNLIVRGVVMALFLVVIAVFSRGA